MSATIPESHLDLLTGPVLVALATVMADGQPHVTPVWTTYDGMHVIVNTVRGRQKEVNMARNPRVTIMALDPQDRYRYIQVQGVVDEVTEEGAVDSIEELSQLYTGERYYGGTAPASRARSETRVLYKVKPTRVTFTG